jgi:hypothetical protein
MSFAPSLTKRLTDIAAASLPQPETTTLVGGCASAATRRCAALRLRTYETRIQLSAIEARQGNHSHRSLRVLGASLVLATLAMIGVALTLRQ